MENLYRRKKSSYKKRTLCIHLCVRIMEQNKLLIHLIIGIFCVCFSLTIRAIAHDRLAIVDHFFDFHINKEAILDEVDRLREEKQERDRRTKEWCDDIKRWGREDSSSYSDDRGTTGPPDRDK